MINWAALAENRTWVDALTHLTHATLLPTGLTPSQERVLNYLLASPVALTMVDLWIAQAQERIWLEPGETMESVVQILVQRGHLHKVTLTAFVAPMDLYAYDIDQFSELTYV